MSLLRSPKELRIDVEQKLTAALADMDAVGVKYFINETRRSMTTQICYYLQGRAPLATVNTIRAEFGLWALVENENKKIITNTLKSKHIDGLAVDIAPVRSGKPWWTAPEAEWQAIAEIMKRHGFTWGGDWKGFRDCPHYEV